MLRATCYALLTLALLGCGGETAAEDPSRAESQPANPAKNAGKADDGGYGDIIQAPGNELVIMYCVRCHGPRQFLQQRGSRDTWRGLIRWMQRDHGMPPLEEGIEDRIVEYLATHYKPSEVGRRRALRADLMPPNPYGE